MKLFAERGYAGVTVRQVASAAGVSAALVIHHCGSKENLRAVLEERVAVFVETMLADLCRSEMGFCLVGCVISGVRRLARVR
jgi:AcrR family transcriptional regulator